MPKRCPKGQDSRGVISNLGGDWGSVKYPKGKGKGTSRIPKEKGSVRSDSS